MENNLKNNKYLIITSSGGAGLLQATKALSQKIAQENPDSNIIIQDVMIHWLKGFVGKFCISTWNSSQRKGRVKTLKALVLGLRLAEFIFWPIFFYQTLSILIKKDIDFIIDTQPLCTSAVLKAIRIFNRFFKKDLYLKKVFVDLPTVKCTHYYNNIKRLSKKDKSLIFISTIKPLLEKNQTEEDFWKKYCKISIEKVCYDSYPIRLAFHDYINKDFVLGDYGLKIKTENAQELECIKNIINKSDASYKVAGLNLEFTIKQSDFVSTILLGSQPSYDAVFAYIKNFIDFLKNNPATNKKFYFFCYCSAFKDGIIQKVWNLISNDAKYPKNLTIIPMSFQQEDVIASLFYRSVFTITRSGGQTAVELMRTSKAKFCVHSEYKFSPKEPYNENKLLKGIPAWESASASYMKEKMNASLVNPDTFIEEYKKVFL
ncbi:MAG: hypothetical protein WCT85_06215 [Parachlamydiales bacterium]